MAAEPTLLKVLLQPTLNTQEARTDSDLALMEVQLQPILNTQEYQADTEPALLEV